MEHVVVGASFAGELRDLLVRHAKRAQVLFDVVFMVLIVAIAFTPAAAPRHARLGPMAGGVS